MSSFKLKLKKPDRIIKFDDSDLSECQSQSESLSQPPTVPAVPAMNSKVVLPRSVPNHLLLVSILEQLCHMYGRDSRQAQDIFKSICEQLTKLSVVSPLLMLDEMSSLREQYRHSVHRMLLAAVHKSNKGYLGKLSLPSPNGFSNTNLPALLHCIPPHLSCSSSDMICQTSRYSTEFVEVQRIGKGGFGTVFKSRNKLDGKMYAVKKVKFKHSRPEVWFRVCYRLSGLYLGKGFKLSIPEVRFRVLREVKALAGLQHTNIVGYNAAWLEYGTAVLPKSSSMATIHNIYGGDNLTDSENDTGIIFQDSSDDDPSDVILQTYEGCYSCALGPKIKEIPSNNSSLASSPQNNPASPPKTVGVYPKNRSQNDMIEYQGSSAFFGPRFKLDMTPTKNISTTEVESRTLSLLSGHFGKVKTVIEPNVKFTLGNSVLDSDTHFDMCDGSMNGQGDVRSQQRVYRRSISCDPIASGGMTRPMEDSSSPHFIETEFPLQKSVTLYMQMELCSHTLREWMQARNEVCHSEMDLIAYTGRNMTIFRQLLKAVDYIHSQGVIHRDLKPRNIFLREDSLSIKVGDFGLATDDVVASPISDDSFNALDVSSRRLVRKASSDHTSGVGTSTYAAPEQLQGSGYNSKSDIYSLGVILFELFQNYGTEMERYRCLGDLRTGVIPNMVHANWPVHTRYIQLMTSANSEIRPSAKSILRGELFVSKDQMIEDMAKEIEELKKQLVEKDKTLAKRDSTIAKLSVELNDTSLFAGTSI